MCAALAVGVASGCAASTPGGIDANSASSIATADRPTVDRARLDGLAESVAGRATFELPVLAADGERELQAHLVDALGIQPTDPQVALIDEALLAAGEEIPPATLAESTASTSSERPAGFRSASAAVPATPAPTGSMAGLLGTSAVMSLVGQGLSDVRDGVVTDGGFDQTGDFRTSTKSRAAARQTYASTKVRDGVTVNVSAVSEFDLEFCPDATGQIAGELEFDVRIDLGDPPAQRSGSYHLLAAFTAQVDDNANAALVELDVTGSTSATTGVGGSAPSGSFVEVHLASSHDLTTKSGSVSAADVTRSSATVDGAQATEFAAQLADISLGLGLTAVKLAEGHWRSGACVRVDMQPDADPTSITPEQEIGVDIAATAVVDGRPTGGTITTRLTAGGDAVVPDGLAQLAPANVTYTAPPVSGGTITATATSQRGIGVGTLTFTPAPGWVVEGNDGLFEVYGVKCDGAAGMWRFTLSAEFDGAVFSGEVIADIHPDTLAGPFTLDGVSRGGPLSIPQHGTGTMSFVEHGDTGTLTFTTDAWQAGTAAGQGRGPGKLDARRATPQECA
jgi:hypothetical protein